MAVKNGLELLTEKRTGGAQPYHLPNYLHDATAGVIAGAGPAMEFDEIVKGVGKKQPDPPEWQVRTVLRFLRAVQPPAVLKERNKFRPVQPSKLMAGAAKAWGALGGV